jgi:antitoxin component YwqK of YwqJK toxin-antitoxin module
VKYFYLFLFTIVFSTSFGQVQKAFIKKDGKFSSDSKNAVSYVIIEKLDGDSAYSVNQYTMNGAILISGFYKDELLTIPNGKFIYYGLTSQDFNNKSQPFLFKQTVGYYINGEKTGQWRNYSKDGNKMNMSTYKNGILNGLYESYFDSGKVLVNGYYQNDLKEGDWCVFGEDSLIKLKDIYEHGKKIKTIQYSDSLPTMDKIYEVDRFGTIKKMGNNKNAEKTDAYPSFDFNGYLTKKIINGITADTKGLIVIQFWVNKEGVVSEPRLLRKLDDNIDQSIVTAIMNSPLWTPALNFKINKNIDQIIYCSVDIHDLKVLTKYRSNLIDLYKHE